MSTIPLDCFYFCEVAEFEREGNTIYYKELNNSIKWRLIIFIDGIFLDIKTGDELPPMPDECEFSSDLFENTLYVTMIQTPTREISKLEQTRAEEVYQTYLKKKKLIEEKKLIQFQQKKLFY